MGVSTSIRSFESTYLRMEAELSQKTKTDKLCDYCLLYDIFSPSRSKTADQGSRVSQIPLIHNYGPISDLISRVYCPICRVLSHLLRYGNETCCESVCKKLGVGLDDLNPVLGHSLRRNSAQDEVTFEFYLPLKSQMGWIKAEIYGQILYRHIAYGDLHFVHPTRADPRRIWQWIYTCEKSHKHCNERHKSNRTLLEDSPHMFGVTEDSIRLIDVERRRLVRPTSPVRYITLSYVWGSLEARAFEEATEPDSESLTLPPGIVALKKQPRALINGSLPRTFEDAMSVTHELGERYIWIDCLCIPRGHPEIEANQISRMDQIYSESLCTIVCLTSGIDNGLPGASYRTPRNTQQSMEQLCDGFRISTHFMNLKLIMEGAAWSTRAWTLQEYLLSRRAIFFGEHQVFFLCKEMSAKESWTRPHTLDDIDPLNEEWADFDLPLPSGERRKGLTKLYKRTVSMYSNRNLTFPGDRHRAFRGLEARLSKNYDVDFLHGLPLSKDHFLEALLWRHESSNPVLRDAGSLLSAQNHWPSWSWLNHPGGVEYEHFVHWAHRKDLQVGLDIPPPIIFFPQDARCPEGFSFDAVWNHSDRPRLLRIRTLALDLNIANWADRQRTSWPPLEIWKNHDVSSARGPIHFHIGIVTDNQEEGHNTFPKDVKQVRLLRLNKRDRPKLPWAVVRGEPVRTILPALHRETRGKIMPQLRPFETPISSMLTWTGAEKAGNLMDDEFEPDACLLVVEATTIDEASRRLGVAYVRMIDFLVAGAEVKNVLLE